MRYRGIVAVSFAFAMVGGSAGLAIAATAPSPGPSISPPPKCFVMKNNVLPLCEQNPDLSWTAIYPGGETVTIAPGDTSDGGSSSGGSSSTTRDIEIAIVAAAIIGVGVIAYRQWGPGRS